MKTKLEYLRTVNNFYQTSSFFPMPVVLAGTLAENGQTNLGAYSLVFPYHVAGKEYFSVVLIARNNSNTAQNIIRTGKVSLSFIPDKKKYLKETVRLGFPGDTTEEKMQNCIFTLTEGLMAEEHPEEKYPQIVEESFQVFECTWLKELDNAQDTKVEEHYSAPYKEFNGITSHMGAHFILRIDKILMQAKYKKGIINDVTADGIPRVPINYGYRDNKNFWMTRHKRSYAEVIQAKSARIETVMYAAERIDPEIKFTKEACGELVKVPRVFLNTVLKGCVSWAKENNVKLIEKEHMIIIKDKRKDEKKQNK